ncbi:MAG: (d)CMP kinase [Clostridiales bacterium]|nr:(d)CMP kinase [Clostridiales bacterium]
MDKYAVAIDGPAGSGKSTIAKLLSERLGILYVDTGAMYRAVGLYCLEHGIDPANEEAVNTALSQIQLNLCQEDGKQQIYLNGENVSKKIRTPQAGKASSQVAAYGNVRSRLVEMQREIAKKSSVVMDGRDIGTNVLPQAEYKFYLNASVEERAKRRCRDFDAAKVPYVYEDVFHQIKERDYNDIHRTLNPLKKADDAIEVDTTGNTPEKTLEMILSMMTDRKEED